MEVGEEAGDFGLVDLVGSQCREFGIDLSQAAFGGADSILEVSQLGDTLGGTRQAGGCLQIRVVGSQLLLEGAELLGQAGDTVFRLKSNLPNGLGD